MSSSLLCRETPIQEEGNGPRVDQGGAMPQGRPAPGWRREALPAPAVPFFWVSAIFLTHHSSPAPTVL